MSWAAFEVGDIVRFKSDGPNGRLATISEVQVNGYVTLLWEGPPRGCTGCHFQDLEMVCDVSETRQ
jgi:uncharacterized protein YodC (DUF2158 family)